MKEKRSNKTTVFVNRTRKILINFVYKIQFFIYFINILILFNIHLLHVDICT